ncbi:MAG: hypothetical protein ACO1OX_09425 [Novosphingobium sp.]
MRKTGTLTTIAAACAGITVLAAPALAGTRPDNGKTYEHSSARQPLKADVGPKAGFPDSPGLNRARDRASDNAAFNRYKSGGAA